MEDQYLALEAFFGPIHDLAIEKGMLNFQGVFKVVQHYQTMVKMLQTIL